MRGSRWTCWISCCRTGPSAMRRRWGESKARRSSGPWRSSPTPPKRLSRRGISRTTWAAWAAASGSSLVMAGLKLHDIGLIELNEAFAVQALAVICKAGLDADCVNVNGGAVALGHPLGCGADKLTATILREMERRGSSNCCHEGGADPPVRAGPPGPASCPALPTPLAVRSITTVLGVPRFRYTY